MSNQLASDKSKSAIVESRLSRFVDMWGETLTAPQFKIAARIFRSIEQNGGKDVRITARQLAEAAGVSERFVEIHRKKLSARGVFQLKIDSTGCWFGFPADASESENPVPEADAQEAPAAPCAIQDHRAVPIADLQVSLTATEPIAEALIVVAPGAHLPDLAAGANLVETALEPAVDTPASAGDASLPVQDADPTGEPAPAAPAPAATALPATELTATALTATVLTATALPATELTATAQTAPAPIAEPPKGATVVNTAAACPEPQTCTASLKAEAAAQITTSAAEQPTTAAASFEDGLTALMRQLTGHIPDAASIQNLQDWVPDTDMLIECLHWLLRRGIRYTNTTLLITDAYYKCTLSGPFPTPFLDDYRRRK